VYNLRHGNYLNRETKKVYRVKLIYLISFLSSLRCELIPPFPHAPQQVVNFSEYKKKTHKKHL
jgi:hypothetical protein